MKVRQICPAGLDCDVSIASTGARFKSTVLRYLCDIDWRFPALVRLVKLWASTCGMNDATAGTFNSFALTLMVSLLLFRCPTQVLTGAAPSTYPLDPTDQKRWSKRTSRVLTFTYVLLKVA